MMWDLGQITQASLQRGQEAAVRRSQLPGVRAKLLSRQHEDEMENTSPHPSKFMIIRGSHSGVQHRIRTYPERQGLGCYLPYQDRRAVGFLTMIW